MTYFAVDPPDKSRLTEQVMRVLSQARDKASSALSVYALVDEAFNYGASPLRSQLDAVRLYSDGRWEQLAEASPIVIQLPSSVPAQLRQALGSMIRQCAGRPMLSFAVSTLGLTDLVESWRGCIAAEVTGTEPMLLRFADTRVAEVLPNLLQSKNWARLCAPTERWWIIGRVGLVVELPRPEFSDDVALPERRAIALSDAEIDRLVQAGMPDALIHAMSEQLPELLPREGKSRFHEMMTEVVSVATKGGVESFPDTYALAVFAVVAGQDALAAESTTSLLQSKDWPQGQLAARLMEMV